ncbi:MAG: hypothetical protein ACYTEZ_02470 [Planctomycetota bacterium]|jgi:hypothetical protein
MRCPCLLLAGVLAAVSPAGLCQEQAPAAVTALKARVAGLRRSELKRLEILLALPGDAPRPELVRAVRIERVSEIATFLEHVEDAALRQVLLLGAPAPAVARVVVTPVAGRGFVLDVTARAFRIQPAESSALVFQSPGLLRWLEDRAEAPHYDLRGAQEPGLAKLLALFRTHTARLTREAQPDPAAEADGRAPAGPLVANGAFEAGARGSPLAWDRVDNLTTFWVDDPFPGPGGKRHGRVLKMDTDVLESEWLKRKREVAANPDAAPWPKTLVEPRRQYATVGATYGVSCYSAPIPVKKGQAYRLTVDFRACAADGGQSKIWVRGYGRIEVRGKPEWRRRYDSLHTLRTDDSGWHTYTNVFHPTKNTPRVERIRVMLYSYWPRGEYRWDDVRIVPIPDAEYRRAKATERSDVK